MLMDEGLRKEGLGYFSLQEEQVFRVRFGFR
jgi:hypothetical protein